MKEIWKDIKEFEGRYQVSNMGRVKSLARIIVGNKRGKSHKYNWPEKILKFSRTRKGMGYCIVTLSRNGVACYRTIHRLVAKAFVPNPENKPQVNHKNRKKADNKSSNLEWCTLIENLRHAQLNGGIVKPKGSKTPAAKLHERDILIIVQRIKNGETQRSLAKEYDVSEATISLIKACKNWKHVAREKLKKWGEK
jgi:hypothetical protein